MAAPDPEAPPVRFRDAIIVRCPYCQTGVLITPNAEEAAASAHLPQPATYNEAVPVGGSTTVHFLECAGCRRNYVARMTLKNRAAFEQYSTMHKYRPAMKRPEPKMTWAGATFQTWMLEVLSNPNWMMRQKAERECMKRGIVLNWAAVARQAQATAERSG